MGSLITLDWPGKGLIPEQHEDGKWALAPRSDIVETFAFEPQFGSTDATGHPNTTLALTGQRINSLKYCQKLLRRSVAIAVLDLPRLEGYEEDRSFQAVGDNRLSTYLSVVREHVVESIATLKSDGSIVCICGRQEIPFVQQILTELLGPNAHIGTIVWQSHYSPPGGKPGREFFEVHQNLVVFSRSPDSPRLVYLPLEPEGYSNSDNDPRGAWDAKQKDAGRDTSRVEYVTPPYEWQLTEGELPPGLWRVSPFSGVVWGFPTSPGEYFFTVQATDAEGQVAKGDFSIKVLDEEGIEPYSLPGTVPWITTRPKAGRKLTIHGGELPDAVVGREYSVFLEASGGAPRSKPKRPSRGWAFGQTTLNNAIIQDRCYFGKRGDAIAQPKKYLADAAKGATQNVTSWWDGTSVGWGQDATKHLRLLEDGGIIKSIDSTAKPELMIARLLESLTTEGETVLEVFGRTADVCASALKIGRKGITLVGASQQDIKAWSEIGSGRIEAILNGKEEALLASQDGGNKKQIAIKASVSADLVVLREKGVFATVARAAPERIVDITTQSVSRPEELAIEILTSEGFIPDFRSPFIGHSFDQSRTAVVIPPDTLVDDLIVSSIVSKYELDHSRLTIYFFASVRAFDIATHDAKCTLKRVPFDLNFS